MSATGTKRRVIHPPGKNPRSVPAYGWPGTVDKRGPRSKDSGSTKGRSVGKKLAALDLPLPEEVLRKQFCKRFRAIVRERGIESVADATGFTEDYCRKLAAGVRAPDLETFPRLAKALGLSHWTDWFDAPKK